MAPLLLPPPRALHRLDAVVRLPPAPAVSVAGGCDAAERRLRRVLGDHGLTPAAAADALIRVRCQRAAGLPAQGYRLRIDAEGIAVVAQDAAGAFYAVATLGQWLRLFGARDGDALAVPGVAIEDAPAFAARGVMLDVSRDKVPTMATVFALVDRLAGWKINQLQLYTEHTFAYPGHEAVWRHASPFTGEQIRQLDTYCRRRAVELVANQNSFGHLHRWLVHEPYRRLAECPGGVEHPFSRRREPFSLCATDPASLRFLAGLYDQLLPNFSSPTINVGLDETFDLGQGRSAAAVAARGKHAVYLDFVRAVHGLVRARGRRMQMWGDIVLEHPASIAELPDDVTALVWGYEADHPFAEQARRFAEAGIACYLCPGTSAWLSFAGRVDNAVANLAAAAVAGAAHGAGGYLITDWGDRGHLQPLPVSYPGLVAGACFAWNAEAAARPDQLPLAELLAHHALGDAGLAAATLALGNAYRTTGAPARHGSPLFHLLISPEDDLDHGRYRGLERRTMERTGERVEAAAATLDGVRGGDDVARGLAVDELTWVADLLRLAVAVGSARLEAGREAPLEALPAARRRTLAARLDDVVERHEALWLARNRPGGRLDSVAHFDPLRRRLAR